MAGKEEFEEEGLVIEDMIKESIKGVREQFDTHVTRSELYEFNRLVSAFDVLIQFVKHNKVEVAIRMNGISIILRPE